MSQSISLNSKNLNNSLNNTSDSGVYLGSSRIYSPTPSSVACRALPENLPVDEDGVIKVAPDATENRINRYQRQSASRSLLPDKRVFKCLRHKLAKNVKVLKSTEHAKCHYGDLLVCGSVWDCPVCAAKISERRRLELTRAVEQHKSFGGAVYLITFTYPHGREDNLKDLLDKQSKAMIWFYQHRTYKELAKRYQKQGRVRALEVNHGEQNGWHPHIHELWFLDLHLQDFETLKLEIFNLWTKACQRYGLGLPSWDHGVDVRGGGDAAGYIAKFGTEDKKPTVKTWGIEDEMTKANAKNGRNGSRSPFQLLDDYIDGDKQAGALFIEYSKAFHRKKQLTWSRGLKAVFDLEAMTDEEIANHKEDKAVLLAEIEPEEWKAITRTSTPKHDNRVLLLIIAENGGADAMRLFIQDLVNRYKSAN